MIIGQEIAYRLSAVPNRHAGLHSDFGSWPIDTAHMSADLGDEEEQLPSAPPGQKETDR